MRRSVEIELNPVYMAEARRRYGDLDARISEIIGWVLFRVAIAQDRAELGTAFDELARDEREFRALVGCEVLGLGSARPDIRDWLCEYVMEHGPGAGARYQVACAYSRLGSEARRSNRPQDAARLARKGLEAVLVLGGGLPGDLRGIANIAHRLLAGKSADYLVSEQGGRADRGRIEDRMAMHELCSRSRLRGKPLPTLR